MQRSDDTAEALVSYLKAYHAQRARRRCSADGAGGAAGGGANGAEDAAVGSMMDAATEWK